MRSLGDFGLSQKIEFSNQTRIFIRTKSLNFILNTVVLVVLAIRSHEIFINCIGNYIDINLGPYHKAILNKLTILNLAMLDHVQSHIIDELRDPNPNLSEYHLGESYLNKSYLIIIQDILTSREHHRNDWDKWISRKDISFPKKVRFNMN